MLAGIIDATVIAPEPLDVWQLALASNQRDIRQACYW